MGHVVAVGRRSASSGQAVVALHELGGVDAATPPPRGVVIVGHVPGAQAASLAQSARAPAASAAATAAASTG
jgi:hypothetical protein